MAAPETDDGPYEVYAIRYAHHERRASENFIGGDPHNGPMPLDYFVWAIRGNGRVFVLDTGFDAATAKQRGRTFLNDPGECLRRLEIDPASVADVIVSHMHYDHCGNHDMFPAARYHLQDREMAFCTGRSMCHAALAAPFDAEDVAAMVRRVFAGRVRFHDGDSQLAP
ncbi:MAG TPA: MBL fold metallo-hydrolase, partial [Kiloniellales bacterium]|nr:MBL fold metallo-hydrolase [Kiloniellales bacterium]